MGKHYKRHWMRLGPRLSLLLGGLYVSLGLLSVVDD